MTFINSVGRPFSDNPKNIRVGVRFNQDEYADLEFCTRELKTTQTDVIKKGIKKVKEEIENEK